VDITASGSELRDAARLARESVVVGRAVALGRWIGTGRRPVTAGQVLRKADVPAAGVALGVDVPPAEVIAEAARFSDEEQQHHIAWGWLAGRDPAQAAREILAAAEGMSPLLRSVAVRVVERLGEDALPAWRETKSSPRVGPHARILAGSVARSGHSPVQGRRRRSRGWRPDNA
jgi:hypothetical protein